MDEIQPKTTYGSQVPHSHDDDEKDIKGVSADQDPVEDERLKAELSGDAEEM